MKGYRFCAIFHTLVIALVLTGCSKRFAFRTKLKAGKPAAVTQETSCDTARPGSPGRVMKMSVAGTSITVAVPVDSNQPVTEHQSASLDKAPLPFHTEQLSAEEQAPHRDIIRPSGQGGFINVLSFLLALTAVFLAILAIAWGGPGLATLSLLVALAAFSLAIIGLSMRRRLNGLSIAALVLTSLHILFTLLLLIAFSLESL